MNSRLIFYKRLASIESEEDITNIEQDLRDCFGNPPKEVYNLFGIMLIKLYLKKLRVRAVTTGKKRLCYEFDQSTDVKPEHLVKLIMVNPEKYAITPENKFLVTIEDEKWQTILEQTKELIRILLTETVSEN
jgi:transcription-repair coupling factor (superfamily II helicase)